jgi:hypothetical protein
MVAAAGVTVASVAVTAATVTDEPREFAGRAVAAAPGRRYRRCQDWVINLLRSRH